MKDKIRKKLERSFNFDGHIDDVLERIKEAKKEHNEYTNIFFEKDYDSDSSWYDLWGEREETDEEAEKRIKWDEQYKKSREDNEYKLYLELKERLGPRILKENLDKIVNQ